MRHWAAYWSRARELLCGHYHIGTGPSACIAPRESTTGVSVTYAPPSTSMSISLATSRPSRITPVRWRMIAGMTFGSRCDIFSSVINYLHWTPGLYREQRGMASDH